MGKGTSTGIGIDQFFENILGAKRANRYWSWGALDSKANRVFLNVWSDQMHTGSAGEIVRVFDDLWKPTSNGSQERRRHLDCIESGAAGYGVQCTAHDPNAKKQRAIHTFDDDQLLRLDKIHRDGTKLFCEIATRVPVSALAIESNREREVVEDLATISRRKLDSTTKEMLVKARLGQEGFRKDVRRLWNHRCAVTGSRVLQALRASHIKPWRECNDQERLDPRNGLLLVANLDALFDRGLITFEKDGELISSALVSKAERRILNLDAQCLLSHPNGATGAYLEFHREHVFTRIA